MIDRGHDGNTRKADAAGGVEQHGPPADAIDFNHAFSALAARRKRALARGLVSVMLTAFLAAVSLLCAVRMFAGNNRFFPLFSFVLFWGALSAAVFITARGGMLRPRGDTWLARRVGRLTGSGTLFVSALEFSRPLDRHEAYSTFLVDETVRKARMDLRTALKCSLFPGEGRPGWTVAGSLVSLVLLAQMIFLGVEPASLVDGLVDPGLSFRVPRGYNLVVTSGDKSILSGESALLEAARFGSARGDVALRTSTVPGVWKRTPLAPGTASSAAGNIVLFRHTAADIREGFDYCFEAGGERSMVHRVNVVHRPVINRLSAVRIPPAYTKARPETLYALAGRVSALAGTRIELAGETSRSIESGRLEFSSGGRLDVNPDPEGFTCAFPVERSDTFTVVVSDSTGLTNEHRVMYPVVAVEDRAPSVEIISPEDDAQLPRSREVRLLFRASDDFGIDAIKLYFTREGKEEGFHAQRLRVPSGASSRELEAAYDWSLGEMRLFPGDRIAYFLEVNDNNTMTGPGRARTKVRRLVVPALSEIYAKLREEERAQNDDLEEMAERSREIRENLKKLSDDFKAEGKLDWSRKREAKEILKKHEDLREKINEAAERLDRTLETLDQNRMTSQEIGEKMEELHRLLGEIENQDLRRLMERMSRMLGNMPQEELAKAMSEMELDLERMNERLDRTLELLRQVLKEEKMEELVRGMEEMLDRQRALRDSTGTGDLDELSREQDRLADEYDDFEENLEEFSSEESDSSIISQMEEMMRDMRQSSIEEDMRKASDEMGDGKRKQAQCTQNSVVEDMLSLYTSLGRCSMSMSMSIDRELLEQVQRSIRELVEVSKLEEALVPDLEGGFESERRETVIARQLVLKEALRTITEQLYEVARKSMMLPEMAFLYLGRAMYGVEQVLENVEQLNAVEARQHARIAFNQVNLAVIELLRSSMSSGSSGGSARERMQMMMQQQLSIDEQLRRMLQQPRESLSMEQRAGMARLAAEQRGMQKLLDQIKNERGGAEDLLGRLDDVEEAMEELAERLEDGKLDDELLDLEERILSRMLESQRSINRRDFKRERISRTAGDTPALSPDEIGGSLDERELLLRMITRGMQEKGPAEYEELIKMYYRALSKKVREGE